MTGHDTGKAYSNFVDRPVDPTTLYAAEDYQRLQTVRAAVDPNDRMAAGHPIPLMTGDG